MTLNGEVEVRFGYSLDHLDALAKLAGVRAFTHTITDPLERTDIAWCGIAEHLYTVDERPTPRELMRAGSRAVLQWSAAEQYAHGHRQGGRVVDAYPRFWKYWWLRSTPSPECGVVERIALMQIWPTLKEHHREALLALAVWDDYALAATAVGVSTRTFYARIERARRQFFLLWHEGERSGRSWTDRRVGRRGA